VIVGAHSLNKNCYNTDSLLVTTLLALVQPSGHQIIMSEELEAILRDVILVLYEQARDEDASYWDIADELSAIINESRGDDGGDNSK